MKDIKNKVSKKRYNSKLLVEPSETLLDIFQIMSKRNRITNILGKVGSGKTYLARNYIEYLSENTNNLIVYFNGNNKKKVNCDLSFGDFDSFTFFLLNVEVKDTSIYLVIDEASSLTDEQLVHLNVATFNKLLANDFGIVVSILSYTVLLDKFEGELERFVLETKKVLII
jgi:predicted AAA+ superfamily ATPase